jgi:hypothetical protein
MIGMYCRGHHGRHDDLCADCSDLLTYATRRIDHCPHGDNKPSCGVCTIRCYERTMQQRIALVMRWSGPRMTLRHPWLATLHLFDRFRAGRRQTR